MTIKLLHYGLQRSGTNYLEAVLKKIENVKLINPKPHRSRGHYLHKHYRFHKKKEVIIDKQYHPKSNIKNIDDIFDRCDADKIIVIKKNIYSWYESIMRWHRKNDWPNYEKEFIREHIIDYIMFYDFFETSDKRVINIKYEDLLFDRDEICKTLDKNGIKIHPSTLDVGCVPCSGHSTSHYVDKYSNFKSKYQHLIDIEIANVNQN